MGVVSWIKGNRLATVFLLLFAVIIFELWTIHRDLVVAQSDISEVTNQADELETKTRSIENRLLEVELRLHID